MDRQYIIEPFISTFSNAIMHNGSDPDPDPPVSPPVIILQHNGSDPDPPESPPVIILQHTGSDPNPPESPPVVILRSNRPTRLLSHGLRLTYESDPNPNPDIEPKPDSPPTTSPYDSAESYGRQNHYHELVESLFIC